MYIIKERIIQLFKDGKILLDSDDTVEINYVSVIIEFFDFFGKNKCCGRRFRYSLEV